MGANLSGASFINTDLRGADFTRANLNEVHFDNIKFDESTIFPEEFDYNRLN
ncbi:pentapeptide repeat-containing protein [Vibrio parahaemolyticus]|nr:pentapeptide repeat-containing protein [Vibrio parahaemolyticus]